MVVLTHYRHWYKSIHHRHFSQERNAEVVRVRITYFVQDSSAHYDPKHPSNDIAAAHCDHQHQCLDGPCIIDSAPHGKFLAVSLQTPSLTP